MKLLWTFPDGRSVSGYRPDVDGLRAIAIIPVVLFHAGLGFKGGFVGVDVFFVISGFLITGIVEQQLQNGSFSMSRFWERRARRILPALLVVLSASLCFAIYVLPPRQLASLGAQVAATLASIANFSLAHIAGYSRPQASSIPLLHTWSLAVEEQFYLFLPLALFFFHRYLPRYKVIALAFAASCSFGLAMFWNVTSANHFYLLPTRAWELLLGSLIAYARPLNGFIEKSIPASAGWIGVSLILLSTWYTTGGERWPTWAALFPTGGASLILLSVRASAFKPNRLLAHPVMRFFGVISYSLYLWHWPLLVFLKESKDPVPVGSLESLMVVAVSAILSFLSWRYLETPFRVKGLVGRKLMFVTCGGGWVVLLAVAISIMRTNGNYSKFANGAPAEAQRIILSRPGYPIQYAITEKQLSAGGIQIACESRLPRCVVLGSSHGAMLGPLFEELSKVKHVPTALLTSDGTSALFAGENSFVTAFNKDNATKRMHDHTVQSLLAAWQPDVVILCGRWEYEIEHAWGPTPISSLAAFRLVFSQTAQWLAQCSKRVIVIGQPPRIPLEEEDNVAPIFRRYRALGNRMPVFLEDSHWKALRSQSLEIFRSVSGVSVLDPDSIFTNADTTIRYYDAEGVYYWDNNHLNRLGALKERELVEPLFDDIVGAPSR